MKQLFLLRNEAIRNNAIDAILSLPIDDKSPHEVHVKEPKRTKAQNDRMWLMLQDVSRQVLAWSTTVSGRLERHLHRAVAQD